MKSSVLKVLAINIALTLALCLASLEVLLRINREYKGISWAHTDYHDTIEKAAKAALSSEDLVLVVGDSFAAHQKDAGGNMFDTVFDCKQNNDCNYYNLAIPGTDTSTYWQSIQYVLRSRPQDAKTKVIMVLYYGNDLHVSDDSRLNCTKVFTGRNTAQQLSFLDRVKSFSLATTFLYRALKSSLSLGVNDTANLYQRADELRNGVAAWKNQEGDYRTVLSRIPEKIKEDVKNDVLNPWQVALAMANPNYYPELYGLSRDWSREAAACTSKSLAANLSALRSRFPDLQFSLIGIPDKFYWNQSTSRKTALEYRESGYEMGATTMVNEMPLHEYLRNFGELNGLSFIHLPDILKGQDVDVSGYFYPYDMHINRLGNIELASKLQEYLTKKPTGSL